MPQNIPSQQALLDQYLETLANQLPDVDETEDSDSVIRGNATASLVHGLYQYTAWVLRQMFADTADSEWLEIHAAQRGLRRKQPTAASGTVILTGTPGQTFSRGLTFRVRGKGTLYRITEDGVTDASGQATVSAHATDTGTDGNLQDGQTGTLTTTPPGLDPVVTIVRLTGGTDVEKDAALLARLLDVLRKPAAGGNAHDYKVWAMSVDGVGEAWVYPLRRGIGTVDVIITGTDGLPSDETLKAVQTFIDRVRPVTAKNFLVLAPTLQPEDVTVEIAVADSTTLAAVTAGVKSAITGYFASLLPGQMAIRSQMGALITEVAGVTDYVIQLPATNIAPVVDKTQVGWLRAGTITITPVKEADTV
ncbi:baseplate J/gp47 family protein [Salmonella enterica]|nr:baseplate J/gp47 family protein [Salmonella enterica]